jgi:hypothetical protein
MFAAHDGGGNWETKPEDVKNPRNLKPLLHRTTTVKAGKLALRGRRRVFEKTQVARSSVRRPIEHGAEATLTVTKDSHWKKKSEPLLPREMTPADVRIAKGRRFARITGGVALAAVGLTIAIGGNGTRMSDSKEADMAKVMMTKKAKAMSPHDQFEAFYVNGGPENQIGYFDDSSGVNVLNTGIIRLFAEGNHANVALGDDCLAGGAYDIRSASVSGNRAPAAYHQNSGGVTITSSGGAVLRFELQDGVLMPASDSTVTTLEGQHCKGAEGIPGGLTHGANILSTVSYQHNLTVPFASFEAQDSNTAA